MGRAINDAVASTLGHALTTTPKSCGQQILQDSCRKWQPISPSGPASLADGQPLLQQIGQPACRACDLQASTHPNSASSTLPTTVNGAAVVSVPIHREATATVVTCLGMQSQFSTDLPTGPTGLRIVLVCSRQLQHQLQRLRNDNDACELQ